MACAERGIVREGPMALRGVEILKDAFVTFKIPFL
jgi:hypothetical protein